VSDLLSQDEIDALLNGTVNSIDVNESKGSSSNNTNTQENEETLSTNEEDVLGEVGNISMGTSATTLSQLLGHRVSITTPKVSVLSWQELKDQYSKPYIVVRVEYTEGLLGTNLLVLNVNDVRVITNLMMGQPADQDSNEPLSELHLSALSEAMNQMVGSACTSIYSLIGKKIDISPPTANFVDFGSNDSDIYSDLYGKERIIKISFRMEVGDLIDSEIMQLMPISFGKELVKGMLDAQEALAQAAPTASPAPKVSQLPVQPQTQAQHEYIQPEQAAQNYYEQAPQMAERPHEAMHNNPVNVQPIQFQTLEDSHYSGYKENIGLIMDVPLQVTVELGRTTKYIREILEFGSGSIIELDKLAGEPVDILVNGKMVAKGEVVVIDESFGVRITDIVHPSKRL
jgi:flagellar motor switch protein FliN/FliY